MIPLSVVDLPVDGLGLGGSRAHVQQQVQVAVQHLDGEEIHLRVKGSGRISIQRKAGTPVASNKNANCSCELQQSD